MDNTPLDLRKTALLLVDLQNDNVHPDGAFASFGAADHAAEQDLVPHVRQLLDWARNESIPVIHNRIVFYPGGEFGGSNAPESLRAVCRPHHRHVTREQFGMQNS